VHEGFTAAYHHQVRHVEIFSLKKKRHRDFLEIFSLKKIRHRDFLEIFSLKKKSIEIFWASEFSISNLLPFQIPM
jgi:hypothetical protein